MVNINDTKNRTCGQKGDILYCMQVRGLVSVNFACAVVFDLIRLSDSVLRTDRIIFTGKDGRAQGKISPSVTLSKRNSTWITLESNFDFRHEVVSATLHRILKSRTLPVDLPKNNFSSESTIS